MKISKLLPVIGVFVFCASFSPVRAQDNPAQAAAREALLKQMGQAEAPAPQPPAAPKAVTPKAVAPSAAIVIVPNAKPAEEKTVPTTNTAPAESSAADQEKARKALMKEMATTATKSVPGPVPIVAPALPISMTKEQRLQALLTQYKSDQITPEQYHTQRAAILAEP